MSEKNEQLKPTPFELAEPPAAGQETTSTRPASWVLPALAGLALITLLVFFWLPGQIANTGNSEISEASPGTAQQQVPAANSSRSPAPAETSPWSDAQEAKLREEAQSVLQELLDLQFTLDERGAALWAQAQWTAATATAQQADAFYRQREYTTAKEQYQQGLQQLQAIEASIPATIAAQLELARNAIESGQTEQLGSALEQLALIEPDHSELPLLRQRADALPEVLEKLEAAAAARNSGDLAAAQQQLVDANTLDPLHQRVATELEQVSDAYLEQRFNQAMSAGYAALDKSNYPRAREQFRKAESLKPGSAEAGSALQEADAAQQASRLVTFKRQGAEREAKEQWQEAVTAYQQALELDSTLLFAKEGLKRSQARARLDKQFRKTLSEPGRLSDVAVAEATEALLRQARTLSPGGPVLEEQIRAVETLLQQYNTLVPVNFRSDGETEVIVYKVARLGRFQETELTLRPGTYQVRGSRRGYRDTLQSFDVAHDGGGATVTVSCTERIL